MRIKHFFYIVPLRLRSLFLRRQVEQELDEELRYHLDRQIEELIDKGMTPTEARYAAMRALGGLEQRKEECRDMRRVNFIDSLLCDLRYGARNLRRNPGFAAISILIMALGIGANTAVFSVVNAVLLRPLPYQDPDRLVLLSYSRESNGFSAATARSFVRWRIQTNTFEHISGYRTGTADFNGNGEPERLEAGIISANLFETLGVMPALGRAFTPEEDAAGGPPAVILSNRFWRRRFGGDPQVIGRALTIGGQSRTIVGIMPPGFRFLGEVELWLPLALNLTEELKPQGPTSRMEALARLKPGMTLENARADLSVTLKREQQEFPRASMGLQVNVVGLGENLVGDVRPPLLVFFGAVVFVLLIACANVANLLLARLAARQKELAIRAAVGAGRLRLVRQLLTESLLLSLIGAAMGLIAAKWGVKLLVAMSPAGIARIEESGVDGSVFGFTCGIAVLAGLLAGIFPAVQASKADLHQTLKTQSASASALLGRGSGVWRGLPALMIAELALALVLLVGAGLMIKSFLRLLAVPKGFNPEGVLTLALSPSLAKYPQASPRRLAYFEESLTRIQALPGVQYASLPLFFRSAARTSACFLRSKGARRSIRGKSRWLKPITSVLTIFRRWAYNCAPDEHLLQRTEPECRKSWSSTKRWPDASSPTRTRSANDY